MLNNTTIKGTKTMNNFLKNINIFILILILICMIIFNISLVGVLIFNNSNIDIVTTKTDTFNGYHSNGTLRYNDISVLVVDEGNIDSIKYSLDKGVINYNGVNYKFVNLNKNKGCDMVIIGSVLHFMQYDNQVLFKSKNCIPVNQKLVN